MKIILLVVVLFFATGVAMLLVARLQKLQQRLAQLHDELARNGRQLDEQRLNLERMAAREEAVRKPSNE